MKIFTKLSISCLLLFCFFTFQVKSQVVYEPSYKTVYSYLSRLAQKGVIDLNDVVLPLSRTYISSKLDSLNNHHELLTSLEKEELVFYLKDYTIERNLTKEIDTEQPFKSILQAKDNDRIRFVAYQDKQFSFNLQPIIGLQLENTNNTTLNQRWVGAWAYGYLGKNIGYSVDFRNSQVNNFPTGYDYSKSFSSEPGRVGDPGDSKYDYSLINATVTAKWKWGSFTFGKNYLPVGYGTSGKIILSDKAPSFPQIRLDINPVKWLSFMYAHAWLNSNIVDSTTFHSTSLPGVLQYQFREKYMAIHTLTLKPTKGLSLMIGESTIYNDKIKVAYLIPIVLFSGINHYLGEASGGTNTISNSQIFLQLSSRNHVKKTHIYASFFIDEFEFNTLFGNKDERNARNHTAYQVGASVSDFPFNNLHLTLEYTKVQPFAYIHFIPAQTYQSNNYYMGHWIGPNADQLFAQAHYRILRGLSIKLIYEYIRKGTVGSGLQQTSYKNLYPFLWGDVKAYNNLHISSQYELSNDLFLSLSAKFEKVSTNTLTVNNNTLSFGINYGF